MSFSMWSVILFASIALSSATVPGFDRPRTVIARFYPDFAQLYQPATAKFPAASDSTIEHFQFFFPERAYVRIAEESLTMLSANVIDRTVTYHPAPNFAVNGSRYFYRRDSKQDTTVEIELVDPVDRVFRQVNRTGRYFYLPPFADLEYASQVPTTPYYEVNFTCNASSPSLSSSGEQSPLLSYIDRSLQYAPRYLLDLPSVMTKGKPMEISGYADIRNIGKTPIVIESAELVAGDLNFNRPAFDRPRAALPYEVLEHHTPKNIRPPSERTSGAVIHQLPLPAPVTIPARTLKSIRFLQTPVMVQRFLYYSSLFSPMDSQGKLLTVYNFTSTESFLSAGRLFLHEQGRFLGQIAMPDMPANSTYTATFAADPEVSYRRQVTVLPDDDNDRWTSYHVEYIFENGKSSRDVAVYFSESFRSFKSFQIEDVSRPRSSRLVLPDVQLDGEDLRGYFLLPPQADPVVISYRLFLGADRAKFRPLP